jgi:drug/metabolite transporter (DMT)-like permease
VGVVLALASALVYGTGDFLGGLSSRRAPAMAVTLCSQLAGLLSIVVAVVLIHGSGPVGGDLAWGAAGGLAGAVALVLFYGALAAGPMSVVAPLTAVISAVVPVVVGLASGERPGWLAFVGVVLALPAVVLIGREHAEHPVPLRRTTAVAAAGAGVGFGLFFVFLARTTGHSGLWPLVSARGASVAFLAVVGAIGRLPRLVPRPVVPTTVAAGLCDTLANALYLAATTRGLLSLVAVVAALYPASTVVLARVVLGERLSTVQFGGLALGAVAVALVAAGPH